MTEILEWHRKAWAEMKDEICGHAFTEDLPPDDVMAGILASCDPNSIWNGRILRMGESCGLFVIPKTDSPSK